MQASSCFQQWNSHQQKNKLFPWNDGVVIVSHTQRVSVFSNSAARGNLELQIATQREPFSSFHSTVTNLHSHFECMWDDRIRSDCNYFIHFTILAAMHDLLSHNKGRENCSFFMMHEIVPDDDVGSMRQIPRN